MERSVIETCPEFLTARAKVIGELRAIHFRLAKILDENLNIRYPLSIKTVALSAVSFSQKMIIACRLRRINGRDNFRSNNDSGGS